MDCLVLASYSGVVVFTVAYHEKWADEAQAWLLARDLPLQTLWLHESRYEGSPALWHTILAVAQHVFHAPYRSLGYIGAAFAIAGVAWLIFRSPFPRPIRWLIAFSYFFVYQYAAIARSYVLFALFAFVLVDRYRDRQRPALFALAIVPLALLTAHGSLLAFALGISYAIKFVSEWSTHSASTRRTFLYSVASIAVFYLLLFAILLPAKDTEATHEAALSAPVLASRTISGIAGSLVDNRWLSLAIFLIFALWNYSRRALISFLLPASLLIGVYVSLAPRPHQLGTILISMLASLAIAWPSAAERRLFSVREKWSYNFIVSVLAATLAYQVYVGSVAIRNDVRLPYSGAQDAAAYLRPAVEQHQRIYGFQYGMVAINDYFPQNIFANWQHAYYHHALGEFAPQTVGPAIAAGHPDYVVTTWWEPFDPTEFRQRMVIPFAQLGYSLVHMSDGYLLTKTGYSSRQIYAIFRRTGTPTPPTPAR